MALILCPECNHRVSDKAVSCPSCGFPLSGRKESVTLNDSPLQNLSNASETLPPITLTAILAADARHFKHHAWIAACFLVVIELVKAFLGETNGLTPYAIARAFGSTLAILALPVIAACISTWGFKRPFFKAFFISCLVIGLPICGLTTLGQFRGSLEKAFSITSAPSLEATTVRSDEKAHYDAITLAHPDWENIVRSGKLEKWINDQSPYRQEIYNRIKKHGNTSEVIRMFDDFKANGERKPQ